jgi:LysM repeat protein
MSVAADDPIEPAPTPSSSRPPGLDPARGLSVCPFLRSRDGSWSSAYASRELRCWAVEPAAQLAPPKQRQLCVTAGHGECATYIAAMRSDAHLVRSDAGGASLWPAASPVPVALESVRARSGLSIGVPRTGGQALLVGLMVVALVVLVIARTTPLGGAAAGTSPAPSVSSAASAAVGASPSVSPSPTPTATSTPQPTPSATPSPTPKPTASPRTYKVRAGDTIAMIAAKFHSSVKAIVEANNIVDPRLIHPGQVLIIP